MAASVTSSSPAYRWYEVWQKIYFRPSVQSFREILADPTARPGRAYLWVAVMSALSGLLTPTLQRSVGLASENAQPTPIFELTCGMILGPIGAVISLAIGAWLLHIIAGLFGGAGSYNRMVYCTAAIQAPATLVSIVLSVLGALAGAIPGLNRPASSPAAVAWIVLLVFVPVSLAWSIYLIMLEVQAVRAAEDLSTGKALLTVFFPLVLLIAVGGACLVLGLIPVITGALSQ